MPTAWPWPPPREGKQRNCLVRPSLGGPGYTYDMRVASNTPDPLEVMREGLRGFQKPCHFLCFQGGGNGELSVCVRERHASRGEVGVFLNFQQVGLKRYHWPRTACCLWHCHSPGWLSCRACHVTVLLLKMLIRPFQKAASAYGPFSRLLRRCPSW